MINIPIPRKFDNTILKVVYYRLGCRDSHYWSLTLALEHNYFRILLDIFEGIGVSFHFAEFQQDTHLSYRNSQPMSLSFLKEEKEVGMSKSI